VYSRPVTVTSFSLFSVMLLGKDRLSLGEISRKYLLVFRSTSITVFLAPAHAMGAVACGSATTLTGFYEVASASRNRD
jgi:hypothetical protein